jgi:hypothetical protein
VSKVCVIAALITLLLALAAAAAAPKLTGLQQLGVEGGIYRARLLSNGLVCATQADKGTFVFATPATAKVDYLHNELGESRPFTPTLIDGLGASALLMDESADKLYLFGKDGNATASCSLDDAVLAVQYGSPVDILAAGTGFRDGFWLLTERGFVLRINDDGKLVSTIELRKVFGRPEAFFARIGRRGSNLYAFSPSASCVMEFTPSGGKVKIYELLPALGGDLPATDAVLLEDGSLAATRGKRLFKITGLKATELTYAGITDDAPVFLDAVGTRVLLYNHTGEMIVGDLQ